MCQVCTKTLIHERSLLHEDSFARVDYFVFTITVPLTLSLVGLTFFSLLLLFFLTITVILNPWSITYFSFYFFLIILFFLL